jgi:hypothetical protein
MWFVASGCDGGNVAEGGSEYDIGCDGHSSVFVLVVVEGDTNVL